jgi:hypothetical protein
MGGMVCEIAMAIDLRISSGIFIVTGGNLEEVSWGSKNEDVKTGHACSREECREAYSQYPNYLKEIEQKGIENVTPAKECFLFDPCTFASYTGNRPILMINARKDEIVSKRATMNLWDAYGRPELIWLPGTHASVYSECTLISTEITNFLNYIKR